MVSSCSGLVDSGIRQLLGRLLLPLSFLSVRAGSEGGDEQLEPRRKPSLRRIRMTRRALGEERSRSVRRRRWLLLFRLSEKAGLEVGGKLLSAWYVLCSRNLVASSSVVPIRLGFVPR